MTGDTVTLREYVDTRFEAQDKAVAAALSAAKEAVAAALAAQEKAVVKAEMASEKRFEGVNEFRASLNDQSRLLMPRSEFEQVIKAMAEKLDDAAKRINSRDDQGKGASGLWVFIIGAISLMSAIAAIVGMVAK